MLTAQLVQSAAMILILLAGFLMMSSRGVSQALVLPLVASAFLVLEGPAASTVLKESFAEFAAVAVIFTAIAIPAHQLQRSQLFRWVGVHLGGAVGSAGVIAPKARTAVLVAACLFFTFVGAALFHNVTAILVMVPIIVAICDSFKVPSRWILFSALIASNLGGFSTSWGDTPNIVESRQWGLSEGAFFAEILPLNLVVMAGLSAVATWLTRRDLRKLGQDPALEEAVQKLTDFRAELREFGLDWRLIASGSAALVLFIGIQLARRDLEIAGGAAAILLAIALDRPQARLHALQSLGIEVYMTLIAVFVMAHCLSASPIGTWLQSAIAATGGATWAIALVSYFGTGLTEAASWASAVAPMTYAANGSHIAAWALGGGICAGSSSILTAASAGIILWTESRRYPAHAVTFRDYLAFGLAASLTMLVFYIAALSIISMLGFVR